MSSKFMRGASLLGGDATVPGVRIPDDLKKLIPTIFQKCRDFGLDFYPTVVQMLSYDEISEIAAYDGFPVRYPHWKWGMEYNELQRGYEHGMHRIYEMVVNTNPCYIYCLNSNTLVDNVTVIAHALFHNDFFKNNFCFAPTSQNMMNQLANNGTRVRKYRSRWGNEKVMEFLDHVIRIQTLIDPSKAYEQKKLKERVYRDHREYHHPEHLNVKDGHDYMEPHINPEKWLKGQQDRIDKAEIAQQIGIFSDPTKDIMGFIRDHAPLKHWQQDIVSMLYEESMYFAPQRMTKMLNEGWASYGDMSMMCTEGLCGLGQKSDDCGIFEYASHKMGVLGGKYSMNPYKLGFCLFLDIEERWNKGKFGQEWEDCTNMRERENWDKKLNLGHEKVLEVRKCYNDVTALAEFFTDEFCAKYEFFEWKHYPNGETKIENRDPKSIKKKLLQRYMNGGLPDIKLVDPNYKGKGYMLLQHSWEGRVLYESYVKPVLQSLYFLWQNDVYLATRDGDGNEIVYECYGTGDEEVSVMTRAEVESEK